MRPKRANSAVSSRCLGKHSTPCSPSARRTCLKSLAEIGWARSIPSMLAPSALPLEWMFMSCRSSVDMRARCLDDRRPLRELRFDERGSVLRRAARRRIDAGLLQALEHRRIVERLVYGLAEAADDRLRRVRGSEDCVPSIALEALQPLLLQRRQLRHGPHARRPARAARADRARLRLRQRS